MTNITFYHNIEIQYGNSCIFINFTKYSVIVLYSMSSYHLSILNFKVYSFCDIIKAKIILTWLVYDIFKKIATISWSYIVELLISK